MQRFSRALFWGIVLSLPFWYVVCRIVRQL